jgi:hypothetical protein
VKCMFRLMLFKWLRNCESLSFLFVHTSVSCTYLYHCVSFLATMLITCCSKNSM